MRVLALSFYRNLDLIFYRDFCLSKKEIDHRSKPILEMYFSDAIPILHYFLSLEGGVELIKGILSSQTSLQFSYYRDYIEEFVPFINKILEQENGFSVAEDILTTRDDMEISIF